MNFIISLFFGKGSIIQNNLNIRGLTRKNEQVNIKVIMTMAMLLQLFPSISFKILKNL